MAYGEQRPAQSNDTPEGRNANRRVLIMVLGTEPASVPTAPQLSDGIPTRAAM
jgi:chemotaxis protein MotB